MNTQLYFKIIKYSQIPMVIVNTQFSIIYLCFSTEKRSTDLVYSSMFFGSFFAWNIGFVEQKVSIFLDDEQDIESLADKIPKNTFLSQSLAMSTNFIYNATRVISFQAVFWIVFLVTSLMSKSNPSMRRYKNLAYSQVLRAYDLTLTIFLISIFLQFQASSFSELIDILGIVLSIVSLLAYLIIIGFTLKEVIAFTSIPEDEKEKRHDSGQALSFMIEDLVVSGPEFAQLPQYRKIAIPYYRFYSIFKKLIVVLLLVFVDSNPDVQLFAGLSLQVLQLILTCLARPFRLLAQLICKILIDLLILVLFILYVLI